MSDLGGVLIIAPHPDDEVYGCSSFLERDTTVLYCTSLHPAFTRETLLTEIRALKTMSGIEQVIYTLPTNALPDSMPALIDSIERQLSWQRPDTLLVPAPSYNQDHRAVFDAALTAARPHDANWYVPRILTYEQPETFGTMRKPDAFRPTHFRPLDVRRKHRHYNVYASQVRGHRSFRHILAIAVVRGMQSNMEYAEAFEVLRS